MIIQNSSDCASFVRVENDRNKDQLFIETRITIKLVLNDETKELKKATHSFNITKDCV